MAFPCTHFNPASITLHLLESIIIGTREISGSDAIKFKKVVMACSLSNIPSSMFTSITWAPPSTCSRAIDKASSKFPSLINRKNFLEPVTFVLSPTFKKLLSGVSV